jgi:hypothetical protein
MPAADRVGNGILHVEEQPLRPFGDGMGRMAWKNIPRRKDLSHKFGRVSRHQ